MSLRPAASRLCEMTPSLLTAAALRDITMEVSVVPDRVMSLPATLVLPVVAETAFYGI